MKVAIMQPYLFPYIGYFQLIGSVDKFIIYDDVNYIKQGWIHRNRILLNDKDFLFTLPVKGAGSFKRINEIEIGTSGEKLLRTFYQAYKRAPYYESVFPLIEEILLNNEKNLSKYLISSLRKITSFLGINTSIIISSDILKRNELKAQEKVIDICKIMNADMYINASGGKDLYDKERFLKNNIILKFLVSDPIIYQQFENDFIPWLSIVDVMMFNSKNSISEMLKKFVLE